MPSRRQIREAAIQFLYCADLEGGADPAMLREPFWEFVSESDRRGLQVAIFKTVRHLAEGREGRLVEFIQRQSAALQVLRAWPEADGLRNSLERMAILESGLSTSLAGMERMPKDQDDSALVEQLSKALDEFFKIDRSLAETRHAFLNQLEDFPKLLGSLEAVAASVRRLQRISDRLRMVENPEQFPEQADLTRLRDSKSEINELRVQTDLLVDAVLKNKEAINRKIAEVVENYAPERVDPVDRAILRLATYEIMEQRLPIKVVINEAIELAKRFGTTDSRRFVNGVLDRIANELTPPANI
ncbi:MAG: transcription antitermination factor NusB [Verrucomicrobia bacterium]|nr:MAG: transcription antitermination factor NusB [Verrucomicrobiota bacterium]